MPEYKWGIILLLIICLLFLVYNLYVYRPHKEIIDTFTKLSQMPGTCYLPYPIYYINMDLSIDRNNYMINQLGIIPNSGYQRISGVNGNLIINKYSDSIPYSTPDSIQFVNEYDTLTNPEIGCTLSHIIAIETAYSNGDEIAMICEDDILLDTCRIVYPINYFVKHTPNDWEILKLYTNRNPLNKNYIINLHIDNDWGCVCYLINRKGMKTIIDFVKKDNIYHIKNLYNYMKVDILNRGVSDYYLYKLCKTYTVIPGLFIPYNPNLPSTIQNKLHSLYADNMINKNFKNILYPYKKHTPTI